MPTLKWWSLSCLRLYIYILAIDPGSLVCTSQDAFPFNWPLSRAPCTFLSLSSLLYVFTSSLKLLFSHLTLFIKEMPGCTCVAFVCTCFWTLGGMLWDGIIVGLMYFQKIPSPFFHGNPSISINPDSSEEALEACDR